MAVKGQKAKQEITNKILETFKNSFSYDKEIRIPWTEDGEPIQIKLTLTAAKVMVDAGGDTIIPGNVTETAAVSVQETFDTPKAESIETSAEEKENLSKLLRSLGL